MAEPTAPGRAAQGVPIMAQGAAMARAMASICNHKRRVPDGRAGVGASFTAAQVRRVTPGSSQA